MIFLLLISSQVPAFHASVPSLKLGVLLTQASLGQHRLSRYGFTDASFAWSAWLTDECFALSVWLALRLVSMGSLTNASHCQYGSRYVLSTGAH